MRTTAAVMRELKRPLSLETIELDPPKAGEVLVRMAAAGLCGSDLHVREGHFPSALPAVCGHEGRASSRPSAPASPASSRATT